MGTDLDSYLISKKKSLQDMLSHVACSFSGMRIVPLQIHIVDEVLGTGHQGVWKREMGTCIVSCIRKWSYGKTRGCVGGHRDNCNVPMVFPQTLKVVSRWYCPLHVSLKTFAWKKVLDAKIECSLPSVLILLSVLIILQIKTHVFGCL